MSQGEIIAIIYSKFNKYQEMLVFLIIDTVIEDERFIIQLPLKENHIQLGDSYDATKRRFLTLKKKLTRQPELKLQYDAFMQEYLELEHLKHVPARGIGGLQNMVGSRMQQDLFNTLICFRQHVYAVSADISKMYRQIKLDPIQCRLQRILWRFSPNEEIPTYELQIVTYGEVCSAFLAIRCLHQAAKDLRRFLRAAKVIKRDFYVTSMIF
ncbi:PREDICTED: uncharacterized protein LOC105620575 [Atta cephalotes]|uniref:Uncharacterized protein n=1 Tax=Atta cephalotes TaxID=12957 RepID=A0A158NIV0_ATTCE|nr:PREDICTED: uncharacterized protein LOC105620575 [Atta cephalotes]